jgi:hypothetical protein
MLMVPPLNSRASGGRHGLKREPPLGLVQRAKTRRGWGGSLRGQSCAKCALPKSLLGKQLYNVFVYLSLCQNAQASKGSRDKLAGSLGCGQDRRISSLGLLLPIDAIIAFQPARMADLSGLGPVVRDTS